jgi:acyl dehydratase
MWTGAVISGRFAVGQRFTSDTYLIEGARIKEFAAEFDPQPFHLDEALPRQVSSRAGGGRLAHGRSMRLLVRWSAARKRRGLGAEIAWPGHTPGGDTRRAKLLNHCVPQTRSGNRDSSKHNAEPKR